MRRSMLAVFLAAAMVMGLVSVASASPGRATRSSYIVVLQPGTAGVPGVAAGLAASVRGEVGFVYENAIEGFSITVSAAAAAALARNPRVAYVEADQQVTLAATTQVVPTGIDRIFATGNTAIGIDGVDNRVDVDVAVIDTGVDFEHPDLNVVDGVNCASGGPFGGKCKTGGDDDHYHGTHVAGTIAALDNGIGVVGVAPGARIHAVKVLNSRGSGYTSWIVAGIDWVAGYDDTANGGIEVANMSLGGSGYSQAEYDAIQGAVDSGVAFAVAAGNSNDDARNYSPAAFDNVLTVSALADFDGIPGGFADPTCRVDQDDTLADFSNWGSAVQIAAPGVCILSTYPIEQGSYGTISGTSMASPHAAGALALLASNNPNDPVTPNDVTALYTAVIAAGNFDWVDDSADGVLEPLLDVTGFAVALVPGGGSGGANAAPVVSIIAPNGGDSFASGTTISFAGSATDAEDGDLTTALVWTSDRDGKIGTGGSFATVLSDGIHVITAAVTDSAGNYAAASITITIQPPPDPGAITLSVITYKVRGVQYADLTWSGAAGTPVDVYRNGTFRTSTVNDGAYTDNTGQKGGGSATYQVCEAGTATCSGEIPATW